MGGYVLFPGMDLRGEKNISLKEMEVKANNPYCGNNHQDNERMHFVNRRTRNTFIIVNTRQGKKVMSPVNKHVD
jgi:hypothetical protein